MESIKNMRLSLFCAIYALFYTFCLYKNYSGVTFPFFAAGTLCFFLYYMKKQGRTMKRFSAFLMAVIMALSINICMTDSLYLAFFDRVFGTTPTVIENHEPAEPKKTETIPLKNDEITIKIAPEENSAPAYSEPEPKASEKAVTQANDTAEASKPVEKKAEEPKKEVAKPANTELQLCFVNIDGDGSVVRQVIKRQVAKSDSPLTTAINLLLQGPDTTKSAERNCMTLIPAGTKLLSAKVQDGVAYLNFNEAFEINTYGVEGYIHQLEQIVFTATAFSTVNSVQFLIEGEKRDYLGSEGQWIGSPLSRSSF